MQLSLPAKLFLGGALCLGVATLVLLASERHWASVSGFHTLIEAIACLVALVTASLALTRYFSRPSSTFLFVAVGFSGTAILDGYHAIVTSTYFADRFPTAPPSLIAWSWLASRTFLGIAFVASWLLWRYERREGPLRLPESFVFLIGGIVALVCMLFFAVVPLPPAHRPDWLLHRPQELLPGALYLVALIGFLHTERWRLDQIDAWLTLSLAIGAVAQVLFMSRSQMVFDGSFDIAHLLKIGSYAVVTVGLIGDVYLAYDAANRHAATLEGLERFFRATVESTPVGILMIDREGTIELVNGELERMFGYPRDELLGRPVEMLIPERFRGDHPQKRNGYLAEPRARRMGPGSELAGVRRDGSEFPLEIGLSPIEGPAGVAALAAVSDVSERKRVEDELRRINEALLETKAIYRTLLDESANWIAILDLDGRLRDVNDTFRRSAGLDGEPQASPIGRELWEVGAWSRSRDWQQRLRIAVGMAATGATESFEVTLPQAERRPRHLAVEIKPVLGDDGEPDFLIFEGRDISDHKQRELELQTLLDQVDRSNHELEQFAYVASHDLQEPLRKIVSYCELLQEEQGERLTPEGRDYLRVAINGARRLRILIQDLLAYSRVTTRGNPIAPTEAQACFEAALENLELAIAENGAQVTSDRLPCVLADEMQLVMLFQNLIGNALKYRGEEPPRVHVGVRDLGVFYEFAVADNGIGFESQYAERIFQVFQRLHNRRQYSGTGIGLAICKRIVERFGGTIWVESEPGRGSTFYFTLRKPNQEGAYFDDQEASPNAAAGRDPVGRG